MTYYFIKLIITALVVVVVSEVAKKSTFIGAIIISIPLTSLLAFIWLYVDTKDYQKVIDLSYGTILLSVPSFAFFIILPVLLKLKYNFVISIIISIPFHKFRYSLTHICFWFKTSKSFKQIYITMCFMDITILHA